MEIMANRLDRGFYMYQKEFEDKALEVYVPAGMYLEKKFLVSKRNMQHIQVQNIA